MTDVIRLASVERTRIDRAVTMASHCHPGDQITLAVRGALQVESSQGTWTVPVGQAVWIPHDLEHAERLPAGTELLTLRLVPSLAGDVPAGGHAIVASPLLQALMIRIGDLGGLDAAEPDQVRLGQVLVDEVRAHEAASLTLTVPTDPRARALAHLMEDAPAERCTVGDLAKRLGTNRRTLERIFVAELGMSVGRWRQRQRLHRALQLLATRRPVADVALESGYASATAFIAAFKKEFGVTPRRYRARTEGG